MTKRFLLSAFVTLSAVASLAGLVSAPAQAASWHTGTDPYATGCAQSKILVANRPIRVLWSGETVSWLHIWYSVNCGTNWLVVDGNPYGGWTRKMIGADGTPHTEFEDDYGPGWSYTMQVYAPGNTCIGFRVDLEDTNGALRASNVPGIYADRICEADTP